MIDINYHHLFYFYTIATEGSITRASEKLLLGQPTLSAQLRQFEAAIGRTLFERRGRRLLLTPEGRVVLRYAEPIFRLGRELTEHVRRGAPAAGLPLRLGVAAGLPSAVVHAVLDRALGSGQDFPLSCVEGEPASLVEGIEDFKLDVALLDGTPPTLDPSLHELRPVGRVPVLFAGGPGTGGSDWPGALARETLLLPRRPLELARQVRSALAALKLRPRAVAELPDGDAAWRLAAAGRGVAPVDVHTFAAEGRARGLEVVGRGRRTGVTLDLFLLARGETLSAHPAASALLRTLRLPKAS